MSGEKRWNDTPLQIARAVARSYRNELLAVAPDRCAALDSAAKELGHQWVIPPLVTTDAPRLRLSEIAEALGQKTGTVWAWANRGVIPRGDDGLFDLAEVQRALAERPARRKAA
ncbi:hypothetical protein [Lentzea albida]|uniref:Helix-turn-helix domain-containing protein n=1 Tax=Lentzea albida TaxID=65499 RepID=A0A1H9VI46_9PSEU|nr:hypothetical protein [Lentzea albida]SES21191.1 hypothetical protein SAMN04488000_118132 [Lentzea albida]